MKTVPQFLCIITALFLCNIQVVFASWEEWWTYDGISGPQFWGRINPDWSVCNNGHRQSPIDVVPQKLLFDHNLSNIKIDKHKVSGYLINTGQSLVFRVDRDSKHHINITGGPLAYRYQFEELFFHFSNDDHEGSEHRIHGHSFSGEIQLYGFNAELYHNMSEAKDKPQGIVAIALMVQIGERIQPNSDLRKIASNFKNVLYKGRSKQIRSLSLYSLLSDTTHYMTYEGSTTYPGCWETTLWVIFNKPIYITKQEMYALRKLMQGSQDIPKAPLGNNVRPPQQLHHRTVRTNINLETTDNSLVKGFLLSMKKQMSYKANPLLAFEDNHQPAGQLLL